jgi:hypothetical protein
MPKKISHSVSAYMREIGKKGGAARAAALSKKQRTDQAKRAASGRWQMPEPVKKKKLVAARVR